MKTQKRNKLTQNERSRRSGRTVRSMRTGELNDQTNYMV